MKKLLALVLALVMTLSLAVVGSNAAFKDAKDTTETYAEAVDVLSGMGVFNGYKNADGTYSFQPKGEITRAEVAAIVYRLYTADVTDKQASLYATYNKFNDMNGAAWAAGYIGYCANAGLVKGYDAKTFGPANKVTGYEALAMILRAVGYDKNGEFTGAQWQLRVASTAQQLGILQNVKGVDLNAAATRELVAELLFRTAAEVPMVKYTPALGYTNLNAILNGTANDTLGKKNFGLAKTAYDYDKWGRPSYVWYNDSNKSASYQTTETVYAKIAAKPVKTYTVATTECQIASDLGLKANTTFAKVTKNGVASSNAIGNDVVLQVLATNSYVGAQGELVEIYNIGGAYQAVIIDTYLAKVAAKTDLKYDAAGHLAAPATITLTAATAGNAADRHSTTDKTWTVDTVAPVYYQKVELSSTTANYEYAVGDFVLVNVNEAANKTSDIVSAATSVSGKQTVWAFNTNKTTVEGTAYDNAVKYFHDEAGTATTKTYTWFFDSYGNLIGNVETATAYDYATISTIQWVNPLGAAGYATAKLTYIDGTTADKIVTKINDNTVSCSEYNNASQPGAADYTKGYVSLNWEKNLDQFCDKHLFRVSTNTDGSVVLEHVFTGDTYAAANRNQIGDTIQVNHANGTLSTSSKPAKFQTGFSAISDGTKTVYATDSTIYVLQQIAATAPYAISYSVVTGYKNVPSYTQTGASVDYVLDTNDYVKYAFVVGTPDSAKNDGLFYLETLTGYEIDQTTGVYTFKGFVDGEANVIKTKEVSVATKLINTGANNLFYVEYEAGYVTAIAPAANGEQIMGSHTTGAVGTVNIQNANYVGQNVAYVAANAANKMDGTVYTGGGHTYATVDTTKVLGDFVDVATKNIWMTYKTSTVLGTDYQAVTAYISDVTTNAAVPAVTITATKNGVAATSPVTATVGDTVVLTATVTNADKCKSLTYQWYNNSGAIVGATGNTYTVPKTVAAANNYYCLATNADDTKSGTKIATTAPASVLSVSVTVNAKPAVITLEQITHDGSKFTVNTKLATAIASGNMTKFVATVKTAAGVTVATKTQDFTAGWALADQFTVDYATAVSHNQDFKVQLTIYNGETIVAQSAETVLHLG